MGLFPCKAGSGCLGYSPLSWYIDLKGIVLNHWTSQVLAQGQPVGCGCANWIGYYIMAISYNYGVAIKGNQSKLLKNGAAAYVSPRLLGLGHLSLSWWEQRVASHPNKPMRLQW